MAYKSAKRHHLARGMNPRIGSTMQFLANLFPLSFSPFAIIHAFSSQTVPTCPTIVIVPTPSPRGVHGSAAFNS
ncbi:hypothetical protein N431DRAFT_428701 [Stipitochalara longipes BDJ]|nr:hypothetical protein N431DRAFT_428701 [Stipitochalara longipes BDJ]